MSVRESELHLAGLSQYVDDLPVPEHCLFAAVVTSPVANGILHHINADAARVLAGVTVITAADIPGRNQVGDILPDERLLADYQLNFIGKPLALVLADSPQIAQQAAQRITLDIEAQEPILDVLTAYQHNNTFGNERQFRKGDTSCAFAAAACIVEGTVDTPAQEHLYFETQATLAIPLDGNRLKLYSASQNPGSIQKLSAQVLQLDMNQIEVEVPRLGGAFGGKEEQAKTWAVLAALGAHLTQRPVKLVLNRQEDMRWTGKRHPYHAKYRLAADNDGNLLAYDVQFLQDGGAVADLSTAILERTLFHATNAYGIPNVDVKAVSCRTHHPSNTAFRGFGAPQAIFTLECALDHLSQTLQMPRLPV
jgi:xanthine dehydrogenase large subunit